MGQDFKDSDPSKVVSEEKVITPRHDFLLPEAPEPLCSCQIIEINNRFFCLKCGVEFDEEYLKNPDCPRGLW